ncbi:MAG: MBL fold metallo-hydrolase [Polyangiales bacterium]
MRPTKVLGPLHRVRAMIVSNVWIVDGGPGDRFVIDTGHRLERAALLAGLRSTGFSPRDLTGVLLTHYHSDHAGNAAFLRSEFGIEIMAHETDAAVLEGRSPPTVLRATTLDPFVRLFCAIENRTSTRVTVDRALRDGESIGSLEVHHAPGHTLGSALFRHSSTRSLFSGDALLAAVPPLTLAQRMCLPYRDFSTSYEQALRSLREFCDREQRFDNLLAGHGDPILGTARDQALRLLDESSTATAKRRSE